MINPVTSELSDRNELSANEGCCVDSSSASENEIETAIPVDSESVESVAQQSWMEKELATDVPLADLDKELLSFKGRESLASNKSLDQLKSDNLLNLAVISDSQVRDTLETIETQSRNVVNELYSPFFISNQSKCVQTTPDSRSIVTEIDQRAPAKKIDEKVPKMVPSSDSSKKSTFRTASGYLSTASSKASSSKSCSSSSSSFTSSFGVPVCKTGREASRDQSSTTVTVSTCPRCGNESALDSDRSKNRQVLRSSKYSLSRRWKGMKNAYRNSISNHSSPYHNIYSGRVGRKTRNRCKYRSESSDHNQRCQQLCKYSFSSRRAEGYSSGCKSSISSGKLCPICPDSKASCPYSLTIPDDHLMSHLCDIDSWHRRRKRETLKRKERAVIMILAIFALLIFVAMGYFGTVLFLRITNIPGV